MVFNLEQLTLNVPFHKISSSDGEVVGAFAALATVQSPGVVGTTLAPNED